MMLIEAKASGQPLADELRLQNLPVLTFSLDWEDVKGVT